MEAVTSSGGHIFISHEYQSGNLHVDSCISSCSCCLRSCQYLGHIWKEAEKGGKGRYREVRHHYHYLTDEAESEKMDKPIQGLLTLPGTPSCLSPNPCAPASLTAALA